MEDMPFVKVANGSAVPTGSVVEVFSGKGGGIFPLVP